MSNDTCGSHMSNSLLPQIPMLIGMAILEAK